MTIEVAKGSVSSCTFGDVRENVDNDPLWGSDEVSGNVVEGGFFHAHCCGWPWSDGFSPFGYCRMCVLFYIVLIF